MTQVEKVDYQYLELRAEGKTYEEIGGTQDPPVSRQRVWQRLEQAKKRHGWELSSFDPATVRRFLNSRVVKRGKPE